MNNVKNSRLVWMDLEMTGLDIQKDKICEIATIITDFDLNIVATGPDIVIHLSDEEIAVMDEWCTKTFTENGLIEKIKSTTTTLQQAEAETLNFIKQHCAPQTSPLCGNSVYNDRMFLKMFMKELNEYLHYRLIDVSTVKELYKRWKPEASMFKKRKLHTAVEDITESIAELKFYRQNFFK